ncbi:MAG: oxygen-independent coproporphyrinogen III oxidase [Bacteroidia bacterium]
MYSLINIRNNNFMVDQNISALLDKYNLPVPRYTSYPTVPFWKDNIDKQQWSEVFSRQFSKNNKEGISLYIHLPFCESLCTYCGCNKKITENHKVENEYMEALIQEWEIYLSLMKQKPLIKELHLGGGTPTFFSPGNLTEMINSILSKAIVHDNPEFSFEGHPNNTTREHLQALYELGFRRVSFGVQDNDAEVQRIINRIQPFENVKQVTGWAREIGYKSVNYDLIYGLPKQNLTGLKKTITEIAYLKPDRIAFYSYAHVPWTSRGQRLFDENDLPSTGQKMELYREGSKLFVDFGYTDIGMDHFALKNDDLYKAWKEGWLHRNFMGYTTQRTAMLLGLGVSSISDAGLAFTQNHKNIHDYYLAIKNNELAVTRGFFLNEEDVSFKKYILDMACSGKTFFKPEHKVLLEKFSFPELKILEEDGLVKWNETGAELTSTGRNFLRNVCRAFDLHLLRSPASENTKPRFSKGV